MEKSRQVFSSKDKDGRKFNVMYRWQQSYSHSETNLLREEVSENNI